MESIGNLIDRYSILEITLTNQREIDIREAEGLSTDQYYTAKALESIPKNELYTSDGRLNYAALGRRINNDITNPIINPNFFIFLFCLSFCFI